MRFSTYILLLNSFFLSCDGLAFLPEETSDHFANAPFITVTSPKGGEVWDMGTTQTITWSFNNLGESSNPIPSSFTIDLYKNSMFVNNIATVSDGYNYYPDEKLGEGSYSWMIPISLSDSNSYKIRISSFDSVTITSIFGESNDHFTLKASSILMPDLSHGSGCENWQDAIVLGTSPGDFTEDGISPPFPDGDYYVNSVIQNIGTTDAVFQDSVLIYKVYLDNVEISSWAYFEGGTATPGSCIYGNDGFPISLSMGTHELKIVVDPDNNIVEFDENNNTYTRTITIGSGFITVTTPNGGEVWAVGSTQTIVWETSGLNRAVSSGLNMPSINKLKPDKKLNYKNRKTSSITWESSGLSRPNNKLELSHYNSLNKRSTKNNNIDYNRNVSLGRTEKREKVIPQIIKPNLMLLNNFMGNVKIELYSDGILYEVINNSTVNTGSYQWDIPIAYIDAASYKIRISDASNSEIFDLSNEDFTLSVSEDGFTITSPNSSSVLTEGSTFEIKWDSKNMGSSVKLYYSFDDGSTWGSIDSSDPNDGNYSWTVPTVFTTNSKCRIKVVGYGSPYDNYYSVSDSFQITASGGSSMITFINPDLNSTWHEDSLKTIQWSTSGYIGGANVEIAYSTNGGREWKGLVGTSSACTYTTSTPPHYNWCGTPDDGTYPWALPNLTDTVTTALIGIWSYSNTSIYKASNHFTITVDSNYYKIIHPNGGEKFQSSTDRTIIWESGGNVGDVKLEYSLSGGSNNWYSISNSETDDGSYIWSVPSLQTDNSNVKIRISDKSNSNWFDVSESVFTIASNVTENYTMDFEDNDSYVGWDLGGSWTRDSTSVFSKEKSAYCTGNSESILTASKIFTEPGMIKFYYKVNFYYSSASSSDYLKFYVDGIQQFSADSDQTASWGIVELYVGSGSHNFEWKYKAYTSSSSYYARIDAISFPPHSNSANSTPTAITLSSSTIKENQSIGTFVGTLTSTDSTIGDTFTYSLVSNPDSAAAGTFADNSSFSISGDTLKTAEVFDYETKNKYYIRIRTTDSGGSFFEKADSISIIDLSEINITSPNGGENLARGYIKTITWTTTGSDFNTNTDLKISLYEDGIYNSVITANTNNTGTYSDWTVPISLSPSDQYKIRIEKKDDSSIYDDSDGTFGVSNASVTLISPNGGESWATTLTKNITWTTNMPSTENVKIYLYKNDVSYDAITTSTPNDGNHPWTIPSGTASASDYKIKLEYNAAIFDLSDSAFNITHDPTIYLTSPNGNEDWVLGTTQSITWSSAHISSNEMVSISLLKNDSLYHSIATNENNDGTYSWIIQDTLSADTTYKIRMESGTVNDVSDFTFTLSKPAITISSPNGGENWALGSTQSITWTSNMPSSQSLKLNLLKNGSLWINIASTTSNDGTYTWTVPDTLSASTNYKIKIEDYNNSSVSDSSDASFNIIKAFTLTSPNGGESWKPGQIQVITWSTVLSETETVKISLYKNGSYLLSIDPTDPNDGSYNWTIPTSLMSISSDYKIRIEQTSSSSVYDESDGTFSIASPYTITSPNGGEIWGEGTSQTITWTSTLPNNSSNKVKIYLYKNGSSILTIDSNENNDGNFTWSSIPTSLTTSNDYKIRIRHYSYSSLYDESDANFSITDPITVTAPNGGESWASGSTQNITWASSLGSSENVNISLYKSGSSILTIDANDPNDGTYAWTIPSDISPSSQYKIRVAQYSSASVYDESDSYFTITGGSVTIGTTSASRKTAQPFATGSKVSRTQILYLASEIGATGTINKIAFNVYSAPSPQTMSNFTVRMTHTSSSSFGNTNFTNTYDTDCILQQSQTISSTDWQEITLDTPFSYNGSSNLIIDISFKNSTYNTHGSQYYTTSTNKVIYYNTDSDVNPLILTSGIERTSYRPNIKLYFQ